MDSVQRRCNARTFTGTGPTIRFVHRHRDEYRASETTGTTYRSSTAWNDETHTQSRRPAVSRTASPAAPSNVVIVHGLDRSAVNCDRLFNLFCLYGNVTAVKIFMDGKRALVELQDAEAAARCTSNLHMLRLDDTTVLNVKHSTHSTIKDRGTMTNTLSVDNSPAHKNYRTSDLNRFLKKATCADHRRVAGPMKILHFYNAPLNVSATEIHEAVTEALGCPDAIRSVVILPKRLPGAKFSSGLIEMNNVDLAAKTIFLLNHMTFKSSGSRFPLKLCFSKWSEIRQRSTSALLFIGTAHAPWMLHKAEHAVPSIEIPVKWTTRRVTSRNTPWTLWQTRDLVTGAIDPVAGNPVEPTDWRRVSRAKQDGSPSSTVHEPAANNKQCTT